MPIGFILKFYLLMNILCSFSYILGWVKWIYKWQEVKLAEKKIGKMISILLLESISIFIIHLVRTYKLNINELINGLMKLNQIEFNFYEGRIYWMIVVGACLLSLLVLVYVKKHLMRIYDFYMLEGKQNSVNADRTNLLEKIINSQGWSEYLLKERVLCHY